MQQHQQQQQQSHKSTSDYHSLGASPPLSPSIQSANTTVGSSTQPDDRRTSSIAALRLKAREHELRLEMLRQNGHGDIIS